jgi:hypothetical protein
MTNDEYQAALNTAASARIKKRNIDNGIRILEAAMAGPLQLRLCLSRMKPHEIEAAAAEITAED